MQAIQDLHQNVRGWSDIGYHFVVDKAGNIYQGRPETVLGAHAGGHNTGNTGVCVLGCYHPPEPLCFDKFTDDSQDTLVVLYAWLGQAYTIDPMVLLGHRDYSGQNTSCPGNNVWEYLPAIREDASFLKIISIFPTNYEISQSYPNPFNNRVSIDYSIPVKSYVSIDVFNIAGEKVTTLLKTERQKGSYTIRWDGRNHTGRVVSSGLYLYRISASGIDWDLDFQTSGKMILMK